MRTPMTSSHGRIVTLRVVLAGVVTLAILAGLLRPAPHADPMTPLSARGELRLAAKELAARALAHAAAGRAVVAWSAGPVVAAFLGPKDPLVGKLRALPEPPPATVARLVEEAEASLADEIARVGEPLVTGALVACSNAAWEPTSRCILMRVLALRWPDRVAGELRTVLCTERSSLPVWEAAVVAGRITARLPEPGLLPALRAAVHRLARWGRQYPIWGLAHAGDRGSVDLVMEALHDPEPAVRRHAALYLGQTENRGLLEALERVARKDPDRATRIVAQEALARLIGVVMPAFAASESELREAHAALGLQAPTDRLRIRQILIQAGLEGRDSALRQVESCRRRLEAGEPFTEVAALSQDPAPGTASGRLSGPLTPSRIAPALRAAVLRLAAGEISRPIETSAGFHIVELVERVPGPVPTLEECRDDLSGEIVEKRRREFLDRALTPHLALLKIRDWR